jgi:hypothetical protein
MQLISTLDDYGKPAWIALMVIGFIIFWPVGLAILGYMIWSGRMGCWKRSDWMREMRDWKRGNAMGGEAMRRRGGGRWADLRPTGNAAFDEYREETLKRLEAEADEFRSFLERLRKARDKAEFDQFMADRRGEAQPGAAPAAS